LIAHNFTGFLYLIDKMDTQSATTSVANDDSKVNIYKDHISFMNHIIDDLQSKIKEQQSTIIDLRQYIFNLQNQTHSHDVERMMKF
jgi:lipopolysaccharide export LptBFGC system permease protein LptF